MNKRINQSWWPCGPNVASVSHKTPTTMASKLIICAFQHQDKWDANYTILKTTYGRGSLVRLLLLCLLRWSTGICKIDLNCATDILKYIWNQPWYRFNSSTRRQNSENDTPSPLYPLWRRMRCIENLWSVLSKILQKFVLTCFCLKFVSSWFWSEHLTFLWCLSVTTNI